MSRITMTIGELVLKGFEPGDRRAVEEGLQAELARVLADPKARALWARSHRTPVLKLGRMPMEPGAAGRRALGAGVARSIGKGLKP
jgi:hypothetical protein